MSLKEILVHLDNTTLCQDRLDVAIDLARRHQSHLTGLYATSNSYYAPLREGLEFSVPEVKSLFAQKVAQADIAADWLCTDEADVVTSVSDRAIFHAYYADLVIVSQPDPVSGDRGIPRDLAERLALGAGRPVLVIPYAGKVNAIGERAMIAWRGGRASSRALNDAIPFLEQAQLVNVLQVNPPENHKQDLAKLDTYLKIRGITATVDTLTADDISIGDMLLNRACDQGVDLIVIGVFARTRFGALGLGPVGRHLLEHMTVPVLMSR